MIFDIALEMIIEAIDARRQQRDLNLGRPGVAGCALMLGDDLRLVDAEVDGSRYLLVRMPKIEKTRLSPREQEIVRMVAEGHPNKVIADVLNISSWTVCTHLRRIFAKLGVGSRAAMVARLFDGRIPGQSI